MNAYRTAMLVLFGCVSAAGAVPLGTAFTFQGQLKADGLPINDLADLRFTLWDAAAGGTADADVRTQSAVAVVNGLFTVELDFGSGAFEGSKKWIEVEVRYPAGAGPFVLLTPRQPLTAAPYSAYSLNADRIDGLDSSAFLTSNSVPLVLTGSDPIGVIRGENNSSLNNSAGIVGTATAGSGITYGGWFQSSGENGRGVFGFGSSTSGTGTTYGGEFRNNSSQGAGAFGYALASSGSTSGLHGQTLSTAGRGVSGVAFAPSGTTYGGHFETHSPTGTGVLGTTNTGSGPGVGVHGRTASSSGRGVFGEATSGTGLTIGVSGSTASTFGVGVFGQSTATTGVSYGGQFLSASTEGSGVLGWATAFSGQVYGVHGRTSSYQGAGVLGEAGAAGEAGVLGRSEAEHAPGVEGQGRHIGVHGNAFSEDSTYDPVGVRGFANSTTGPAYGGSFQAWSGVGVLGWVVGQSPSAIGVQGFVYHPEAYGVYANGNLGATGTKSFQIDHPDDPENKYLRHFSAESPEVINFYSGTVTLDDTGEAVVELPPYFAKINTDPRYQLTAVGAPMPMLHVAEEIDLRDLVAGAAATATQLAPTCSFRIAGGKPNARVSWEVKAVRNDLYVRHSNPRSVLEKPAAERGTYERPEFYGQPREKRPHYNVTRDLPVPNRPNAQPSQPPSRAADSIGNLPQTRN